MKSLVTLALIICVMAIHAQETTFSANKKWGAEINLLWPIFPGDIYKGQVTYETWNNGKLSGDAFAGIHMHPTQFREDEGDFGNFALTFGYRQFLWKELHIELYNAFGPGWNRNNVIDGNDYDSWDYEIGGLLGYNFQLYSEEKRKTKKIAPYIGTQHGVYYLAYQTNPHPIKNFTGETPFYVGTLNFGIGF